MQGVISLDESRKNIDVMSKYYQEQYKECVKKQIQLDEKKVLNKWKVNVCDFACSVGLLFASPGKRILGNLFLLAGKPILKRKLDKDIEKQKQELEVEKNKIAAMFIADDGSVQEFVMPDGDIVINAEKMSNKIDDNVQLQEKVL